MRNNTHKKKVLMALTIPLLFSTYPLPASASGPAQAAVTVSGPVIRKAVQINPTSVELQTADNHRITIDFYGDNIFRIFQDNNGGIIRDPEAKPEAQILVKNPRGKVAQLDIREEDNEVVIFTSKVQVQFNRQNGLMKVSNLKTGKTVIEELQPVQFDKKNTTLTLKEQPGEYFYGGGVQNGRFSHKGKVIAIVNQNSWTDGGVASPTPFYWSTAGYGMMWYTFRKGQYDFGSPENEGKVTLSHETDYLDVFFMVDDGIVPLLNDFYQLTGNPVLLPKFGFYEGHLNAYNRDYWVESEKGILFEDGKRYKESQKDNGGVKESLNGEKNNYQFSARAVIDRYKMNDMPLGWILPNDGYGAGYGQTETLDGNIQNLKDLGDYARKQGVEIGLWTQSELHPKKGISALLQRDIVKEVRDAGVRVLKTDVAWVGAGYSFGLNGVSDVGQIMPYYGNDARPFIISLDGWAGTQRYASIWSGDQTGGQWEYIRFHIPTYIGSGLSGQPNITSDMDGIFGGRQPVINTRDFQWKTWTPMQLNMDGWGANEKYPHALGEPATSINRWYLKMKSEMLPYTYSIARESVEGKPMIRAMFIDDPNTYTLGKATQYQYMYGPYFLVAPIYQETASDKEGNDIRNGIYLPEGTWIDYFTGEKYEGGRVLNNFDAPLWKLPVFVKSGAIIPMTHPNNNVAEINQQLRIYNVYPDGESYFTEYDDDGRTLAYRNGEGVKTYITSSVTPKGVVEFTINPAMGDFKGFQKEKETEIRFNVTKAPKKVMAKVGGKKVKLTATASLKEFENGVNVYFYNEQPNLNRFATAGSDFAKKEIIGNPQLMIRLGSTDITANTVCVTLKGFEYATADSHRSHTGALTAPAAQVTDENLEAYTAQPTWNKVENADYYEIELNDVIYSTIRDNHLMFEDLEAEKDYNFKIRAVNKDGASDWSAFNIKTKSNPLEFALQGIRGECTTETQGWGGVRKLFNFDEAGGDVWHSKYGAKAVPFDIVADLRTINQLDKIHYLPRLDSGNGTIMAGTIAYSMDKVHWTEAGSFEWARDPETKVFEFKKKEKARYVRISVTKAVGDYGSGREFYIFKVPGTESFLPGDINKDRKIDGNDLTSFMNYTGLRSSDSDFDYIKAGDINQNGLIDAYDISVVATQLEGGIENPGNARVDGKIDISINKTSFKQGETVEITVRGTDLKEVNAISFALPYNEEDFQYEGVETPGLKKMENLTYDRLHTNGQKSLYPTFVNKGDKEVLSGTSDLFKLKFKAKRSAKFNLKATDGILSDKNLNILTF